MILYHAGAWGGETGRLAMLRDDGLELHFLLTSLVADVRQPGLDVYRDWVEQLRAAGMKRLFLDSGAFSAWTQGETVPFEELYEAIEVLQPEVYVQLDVIGDAEGTRANLERMRADGYKPLPVFTRGAPWSDLRRLLDEGETYICLGNIAKASTEVRLEWCRGVFAAAYAWMQETGNPLPRFHAFGVTQQDILGAYPFYSCDSSAAIVGSKYGRILEWHNGRLRSLHVAERKHISHIPHLVDRFAGDAVWRDRIAACYRGLNAMARHYTKVWAARGITWPDQQEHLQ